LAAAQKHRILPPSGGPIVVIVRLITVIIIVAGAAAAARAELAAADRDAIEATISAQIEAFQRDDGDAAFAFAAPGIRAQFGDAETFMAMVQAGYNAVYRPQSVRFLSLEVTDGVPTQEVHVIGPDGVPYFALYLMERQADGSWRIGGVLLVRAEDKET
jgi:ketosteroid isomerase-like protein